ncbi:hypothetical protein ACIBO9_07650 [Streptomyces prunicolor]|uniref:hypothetical protein n=1 Tax=Streptomyces prunicolor TaxID=67348 RepID=UPI0037D0C61B
MCFSAQPPCAVLRSDGPADRVSFVGWSSDAADGSALVRSDPLPSPAERYGYRYRSPYPYPYPAPCPHADGPLGCDVHLWVDADSPERTGLVEHADVLVSRVPLPLASAQRRVRGLLLGHPGCRAAAVPDTASTCVVGVRERTGAVSFVPFARLERGGSDDPLPAHVVVSVVHAWAVNGGSPGALRSVVPMPRN